MRDKQLKQLSVIDANIKYNTCIIHLDVHVLVFTTWGRSPQVVPKIVFTHVRSIYLFIYLYVNTYISSIHVVLEK